MEDDGWKLLDRQMLGVTRLTLTKNVAHNVVDEKTTEKMMSIFSDMYEKPSVNNKVHLMQKLFNLNMGEGASMAAHINEFNMIVSQLTSVEIDFDDDIRSLILWASLPNVWESMCIAVRNSVGKRKLKFSDFRNQILAEEVRMMDSGEQKSLSYVLNLENRGMSMSDEKSSNQ